MSTSDPWAGVGQTVDVELDTSPLDALVDGWAATHRCPSIVWGVVRRGELVVHGASGTLDGGSPPTERTVYRIASMTKSFSAAATLLLRDEGHLRLDDPLGVYASELVGLRSPTADAAEITVRDLLCMTSGLVTDDAWADRHLDLTDDEFDAAVAGGLVFGEPTGNAFEYSNFGFALLGRVVHRATGTRIQAHITDRLLRPLGMTSTTWVRPDHDDWARPKRWIDHGWIDESPTAGDGMIAPMGGLWTTVADLGRWVSWLADAFPARDDRDDGPLSRASRREMQTPQRYAGMRTLRGTRAATSYGYGVRVLDEPNGTVIAHSGGLPGYGSNMRWTPGGELGVIALANSTYAPMTELGARLHDHVRDDLGLSAPIRPVAADVDTLAHRLVSVLDRWGRAERVPTTELDEVFADNVGPDDSFDRRANAALGHGSLRLDRIDAVNDARARVTCTASGGTTATLTFSLAPTRPPCVQDYELEVSHQPNDA